LVPLLFFPDFFPERSNSAPPASIMGRNEFIFFSTL
jgi:hypothetical protein